MPDNQPSDLRKSNPSPDLWHVVVENPSRLAERFIRRSGHCCHISHGWWGWFCWRLANYDGYCAKHNRTCFHECVGSRRYPNE